MSVYHKVSAFLGKHGFPVNGSDINGVIDGLLYDMQASLDNEADATGSMTGAQDMIPTWMLPPESAPVNKTVLVIDAGGTNFRSCLVNFDESGTPSISHLEKCFMPGNDKALSKLEFFDAIAANLEHLRDAAHAIPDGIRIGFCFSFSVKITPDGDGQILAFSKENKAKDAIGSFVGASLSDALVNRGWKRPEKIVLLNDTTAALLAGASNATGGRRYSSYVGLILGTGMNTAYIEPNPIKKIASAVANPAKIPAKQIVVCESGRYNKLPQSDFDKIFDKSSTTPGHYIIEKMCSGAYLGPVTGIAVKMAAEQGLFSAPVAKELLSLKTLELKDMDAFLTGPYKTSTLLGGIVAKGTQDDYDIMYALLDAFVDRSARLATALVAASIIKSGQGTSPALPVSVLCEGTTFYKTHNLQPRIRGYLNEVLLRQRQLHFEIVTVDNAVTLGAAVAGLQKF